MAKKKMAEVVFRPKTKIDRPGVHSKKRSSNHKNAKNYTKKYRGQGR